MKINEAAFWAETEKYVDIRENGIERHIEVADRILTGNVRYDQIDALLENVSEGDLLKLFNEICYCNDEDNPEMTFGWPRVAFTVDELFFNARFTNYLWSNTRKKSSFL